jgi:hypothetical protein
VRKILCWLGFHDWANMGMELHLVSPSVLDMIGLLPGQAPITHGHVCKCCFAQQVAMKDGSVWERIARQDYPPENMAG